MKEGDKYSTLSAVLGIVIGILGTVLFFSVTRPSYKLNGDYSDWRKLNLILEQVQENYVDTVDVKKVTDAAVVASLASLDPHSIYLPPVDLENRSLISPEISMESVFSSMSLMTLPLSWRSSRAVRPRR